MEQVSSDRSISRRTLGRAVPLLGGAAVGTALSTGTASAATSPWNLTGNAGTAATNFLGTTDAKPLVLRTANAERLRISATGDIGIGTTTPTARLHVARTATTGASPALQALTASKDADAKAIFASVTSTTPGANAAAVRASNAGTTANGIGVWGSHAGTGVGIQGTAAAGGIGVRGTSSGDTGLGVLAQNPTVNGSFRSTAIRGLSGVGSAALLHPSDVFWGGGGEFCGPNGVIGASSNEVSDGYGVIDLANNLHGVGVYAQGTGGAQALVTSGNADIVGTLTKSGGSFKIDHPLDPANKYLSHSFVESPDMKNIYDGVVTADADGTATVTMPTWFDALNRDLRYQLTPLGAAAPGLHVAHELADRRFSIAGAQPGQRICWQVTGNRQDAWANANRIPVESAKTASAKGSFLHPALHGAPATAALSGVQA